jgi:hypothetical protein
VDGFGEAAEETEDESYDRVDVFGDRGKEVGAEADISCFQSSCDGSSLPVCCTGTTDFALSAQGQADQMLSEAQNTLICIGRNGSVSIDMPEDP